MVGVPPSPLPGRRLACGWLVRLLAGGHCRGAHRALGTLVLAPSVAGCWGRRFCVEHGKQIVLTLLCPLTLNITHGVHKRGTWRAPGPEGIPVGVWARFRSLAAPSFLSEPPRTSSRARCLQRTLTTLLITVYPPKVTYTHESYKSIAQAHHTRPTTLKNTSTGLIIGASAPLVSGAVADWASQMQRGSIRGGAPLLWPQQIDAWARFAAAAAPLGSLGALVLMDFTAAFPSISRGHTICTVENDGFPPAFVRLAAASWAGSKRSDGYAAFPMLHFAGQV